MAEEGKMDREKTQERQYISGFSQSAYLNHSLMSGKNCIQEHFAALVLQL